MTSIAIIGGGIGGLTAALTLRQCGFEPEVFEQAPELLEVGAAIAVWPNAMRVLERLGLGAKVLEHAGTIEQVCWLDYGGRLINSTRLPHSDAPAVALQRADLQNILVHALPPASVHLNKVFESFAQEGDESRVRFADGSTIRCELLLGCDGLHSHVRAQLVDDRLPVYRGYTVWRGTTNVAPQRLNPATAIEIHGRGRRFGIGPVGAHRIGWWATANQTLTHAQGKLTHAQDEHHGRLDESPTLDRQRELLDLFAGWYAPVLELIEGTPAHSIVRNDAFDRPATSKWGQGGATLLGDAVHPTTPNLGQGGCLAIEDAAVLARCLQQHGATSRGLRAYEQVRYTRTKMMTGYSRIYGSIGQWEGPWTTRLRTMALALVPPAMARRLLRLIFDYDAYRVRV